MEKVYVLDVRVPKQDNKRIEVLNEIQLGSDEQCDLRILDHGLSPLQGRFRVQNGVLTFTHLGADDSFKVGSQKCGHGRMYILSKGDKCTIEKVKIIVREEKREIPEEIPEEDNEEHQEEALEQESVPSTEDSTQPETILEDDQAEETEESDDEFEYVEEEVYVDEDGNEVDAPVKEKKPGLFARLFKRNKAPKEEKKKEEKKPGKDRFALKLKGKKKSSGPIGGQVAGPLSRFFGLLYTLFFFSLFLNLGLPLLEETAQINVATITHDLWLKLDPFIAMLPAQVPTELAEIPMLESLYKAIKEDVLVEKVFHYSLLFLAFEILFQFLLALPLGHFLIGLKNNGNGVLSRLLSPIRVIMGWLLLPFLIFDFPILLKKRSFKELTTASKVVLRSKRLTFFLSLIFLPLLSMALLNIQLLLDYNNPSQKIALQKTPMPQFKSKFNEVEFSYKSLAFGVEGKAFLDPRIRFIPGIIYREKKFLPYLSIVNSAKNNVVTISKKERAASLAKLKTTWQQDPLFSYFHHSLDNKEELFTLLYHILALTPQQAYKKVQQLGPFLGPYYSSAKGLKSDLSNDPIKTITLYEGKGGPALMTKSLQVKVTLGLLQLRTLENEEKVLDVLMAQSDPDGEKFNEEILQKTFFNGKPFNGTYSSVVSSGISQKDLRSLALIAQDILHHAVQKKPVSKSESQIITKVFLELSKTSIREEDEPFQLQLLEVFKKLDKVLQRVNKSNAVLTDLRLSLNRIQKALFKRDQRFFEVNK